jgi:hypothetical protein
MGNVPHDYLLWLFRQTWIKDWPDIHVYLMKNLAALLEKEAENEPKHTDGFESYDDYMRYGRD